MLVTVLSLQLGLACLGLPLVFGWLALLGCHSALLWRLKNASYCLNAGSLQWQMTVLNCKTVKVGPLYISKVRTWRKPTREFDHEFKAWCNKLSHPNVRVIARTFGGLSRIFGDVWNKVSLNIDPNVSNNLGTSSAYYSGRCDRCAKCLSFKNCNK